MSTTGWYCGGLAGIVSSGAYIHRSYSSVTISGTYPRVGGLAGENDGGIYESYATGNVTGTGSSANQYGGLLGLQLGTTSTTTDSYASGNVSANSTVAGFVGGIAQGLVTKSYASGSYTATSGGGGFVDYLEASPTISNSFWDTDVAGATSDAGTGKTTAEMNTQSTFTNAGWDFTNIWAINASVNDGYPYLRWQNLTPPDTTDPTASTTAPTIDSVVSGASVTLSADASDETALAGVSFYVNGILQGIEDTSSPYSITWDSTATTSGQRTILSVARDSSNNYGTSTAVTFVVDNDAPSVSITAPTSSETVSGSSVTLSADASDTDSSVSGVSFYVDDVLQGVEDTSTPYSVTWDSTAAINDSHTVYAVAVDEAGNRATSTSVTFTVSNTSETVPTITTSTSAATRYKNLMRQGKMAEAEQQMQTIETITQPVQTDSETIPPHDTQKATTLIINGNEFSRDLTGGIIGDDVVTLQNMLIKRNIGESSSRLAEVGATGYFGKLTKAALAEFQSTVGIFPSQGYFGPITRAWLRGNTLTNN